ncbi:response regulator transcription factor [Paenibacillus sp. MMS20-IR301]|uniref:response regulator transcription factor n=1 Tax=Paenibacillus sp. MMS20-IR301 TaxID=2895946 RepID=UPI0028E2088E|nr:response regulator transcription factor [Paenibacillus sp. MMS20-IR301]WNS47051.1 response regulator transcription factor [Paenibacillus sp. MMS20-IR301]
MNQTINILVVEDDNDINQLLCDIIRRSGYIPQSAFSGTEAMLYLERQAWDLVLLDLMLPGMDGEGVLGYIAEHSAAPVIIISAKLDQKTKIETLRTGADDYITKPFDIEEVSARIDSHLRRAQRAMERLQVQQLQHKDIVVDTEAKSVSVQGAELAFTAREYEILALLMLSPKKVFTKANLFKSVWNEEFHGDDNTINVHMSNIRSKLAKVNPDEEYIETVWGVGYRLKT